MVRDTDRMHEVKMYYDMSKIHITVEEGIEPSVALEHVAEVMKRGRISGNGKYYCYVTDFTDGVRVRVNEYRKSDCFVVEKYKNKTE